MKMVEKWAKINSMNFRTNPCLFDLFNWNIFQHLELIFRYHGWPFLQELHFSQSWNGGLVLLHCAVGHYLLWLRWEYIRIYVNESIASQMRSLSRHKNTCMYTRHQTRARFVKKQKEIFLYFALVTLKSRE